MISGKNTRHLSQGVFFVYFFPYQLFLPQFFHLLLATPREKLREVKAQGSVTPWARDTHNWTHLVSLRDVFRRLGWQMEGAWEVFTLSELRVIIGKWSCDYYPPGHFYIDQCSNIRHYWFENWFIWLKLMWLQPLQCFRDCTWLEGKLTHFHKMIL